MSGPARAKAEFLPDTSCMIAAVCAWHEHHEVSRKEIERRLGRAETMVVAAPAAVESYAVLTRLPPPHRLSPRDALALIEANFLRIGRLVTLDGGAYRTLLREAPEKGVAGGRTYDAVIAACARQAGGATLLTFDADHFASLLDPRLEIVILGQA